MSVPGQDEVELCDENRWSFPGAGGRVEAEVKAAVFLLPLSTGDMFPDRQRRVFQSHTIFPCFFFVEVREFWGFCFGMCSVRKKENMAVLPYMLFRVLLCTP